MSEKNLDKIHYNMMADLKKQNAHIDDIFYAPYYKKSKFKKYRRFKNHRKPGNGMLIKAIKKWNIDINSSIFIGDRITDKIAASRSKIKFYFKGQNSLYNQIKLKI